MIAKLTQSTHDPAIPIANEELPRTAAAFGRRFDQMAESAAENRFTERKGLVDRAARLQEGHGLPQHPVRRHESEALALQSLRQLACALVILIAPVTQRDPGPGIDEDGAKRGHRRRRERLGAP